jgi:hypothetical protein
MSIPGPGTPGKLPFEVTVSIRGPLFEVTGQVLDLSALGLEVLSPKRFPDSDRVGLTLRSMAVRGPGCVVPGNIGTQREQPDGGYFIRIDFVHSAESQKNLQTFLWGIEEARQTKRRENPPGLKGRGSRTLPASRVAPRGSSLTPVKPPGFGSRIEKASIDHARERVGSKLPIEVTVSIRGPLFEVTGTVLDLSALGLDVLSPKRFPDSDRVGLTLHSMAVRGPGCVVPGNIGIQREQPDGDYFIRIDFVHSPESEKNLQTFLWGVEEAGQTKRRENPPAGLRGRGSRSLPAPKFTPRGSSGGSSPSSFPPVKSPGFGSRHEMGSLGNAGAGDGGKLPVEVNALIRGPLYEVSARVLDLSATSLDVLSNRHVPQDERVGLTLKSAAIRGPGIVVSGDVRTVREEPGGAFFVRIDFSHTGDSEKRLQTLLWGLEEARQTKRREKPPPPRGRAR